MRDTNTRRAAIVIGLFVVLFGVRFVLDDPTYIGATFLLVLPTVLAALWFGVTGGVAVAVSAAVAFFVAERLDPSQDVELHTVVWATVVRLGGLVLVAVLVARLFTRQLEMARELDELEAVRDALRPAVLVPRPELELAAHYVPAQQGVGGDFFLTAEGPRGSTVLLVGDVVGKGVHAARRAVFVRTSLVTFAPFEDDPARLLRLANAALIDRAGTSVDYVTAVCVVHRPADETLAWAIAGHPAPLRLDDGEPLDDWERASRSGSRRSWPWRAGSSRSARTPACSCTPTGSWMRGTTRRSASGRSGCRGSSPRTGARARRPWWSTCAWRWPRTRRWEVTTCACSRHGTGRE